jgi:hypothetical protein
MTKKLSIAGLVVAAAASSAFAFGAAPAKAACLPTNPSASCSTFDPSSTSNVQGYGDFTGFFNPSGAFQYTKAAVQFSRTGTWDFTNPITISGISITGDGITSSLPIGNFNLNSGSTSYSTNQTSFQPITAVNPWDATNSTISFDIPAGVASPGATLTARIVYTNENEDQLNTTGNNFSTTSTNPPSPPSTVPGPLPLLGAGAAFGFSRSMRRRIAQSV